jgi:EmrB/QacA subfamily drug resistance transporter
VTAGAAGPERAERAVLATVALGTVLAPLNSTMIAVALPRIMSDFDADVAEAAWLVTGYLIAIAALQPITGKLGDRLGRRPLMLGGLVGFGLASLGAALAPTLAVLIGFRVLQAVAGAVSLPNGVALIREVVPASRRAARFGLVGAAAGVAAAIGPALGGLVIVGAGWRATFAANLPIVVVALVLAWRFVPRRPGTVRDEPFDLAGSLLLCGILAGFAALLVEGSGSAGTAALVVSAVVLAGAIAVLLRHELRHPDPVVRPRLFLIRPFAAATSGIALGNIAMYTILIATPILLADEFGWTSAETGLALTVLSAPMVVFGPLGGRLADRRGRRLPAVAGHAIATLGLLPLVLGAGDDESALLACLGVAGVGFGLSMASLQTSAVESVEPHDAGVASGLFATSRYIGSIVGSVALATLLVSTGSSVSGFHSVALLVTVSAFFATIVSLGLRGSPERSGATELQSATSS